MSIRPSRLCLSLLAFLWAGGVASAEEVFLSGETSLSVSPTSVSGIPIDVGALAGEICGEPQASRALVQCHVIVKNVAAPIIIDDEEDATVEGLRLAGAEPLETPCGLWDTTLTLDPDLPRPASPIAFTEKPGDPGHGLFAAVLEVNTRLHLVHRKTGRTADFPLRLGLGLAGPWTVAPPVAPSTAGRLLLLADRKDDEVVVFEQCIPAWVLEDPHFLVVPDEGCKICFVPTDVAPAAGSGAKD